MANFNQWIGIGNLTRDPEMRYTPKGMAVCNFGMAVNRNWKSETGEKKEEVLFVNLTAFGKQAETIAQYCRKGSNLMVVARLKNENYEAKDGRKVEKMGLIVESFQFLGGKKAEAEAPAQSTEPAPEGGHGPAAEDDVPF